MAARISEAPTRENWNAWITEAAAAVAAAAKGGRGGGVTRRRRGRREEGQLVRSAEVTEKK
jgi:hypothetical protein